MTELVLEKYSVNFIDGELGRGGFGTVYKGLDKDKKTVAIKKVSKEHKTNASTEAAKSYFIKKKINHDQIVKIYDVKSWRDSMWIIMEYCELGDLDQFFKRHTSTVKDLLTKVKLMKQIANAVQFLHSKDVVHRDIKPVNILVKLTPDRLKNVLIKLGDFGLSRFLEQDLLTSAMSTNVGTLMYKAPELFNAKPGQPVKYHRNIDVYSTGLTFAAMLQAKPGQSLIPIAEGSLRPSEMSMPIGLATHTRVNYQQAVFNVVEDKEEDDQMTRNVKQLIQRMTQVSPKERLSSPMADEQLAKILTSKSNVVKHRLNLKRLYVPNSSVMCFLKDKIVSRGRPFGKGKKLEFNSFEVSSGTISHNMVSACNHWLSQGCLATCWSQEYDDEYLVEACPECRNIRIYDSDDLVEEFAFENVRHSCICSGPEGTIFVWGHMKLLQMGLHNARLRVLSSLKSLVQGSNEIPMAKEVASMCYAEECNTVVILADCNDDRGHYDILGIKWSTGVIAWKHCDFVSGVELDPEDVSCTPRGDVCVANTTNVLLLDPKDGSLKHVLFTEENLENVSEVVCYKDEDEKEMTIAVRHGAGKPTKTSCFSVGYDCIKHDEFAVPVTDLQPEDW